MYKSLISLFIISFLTACGGPVDIEGDVFLVKGDGKPQPAAAKEVIFLPINEDGSLEQLLTDIYLDAIKEEVEKNELSIKDLCTKSTNIIQNSLDKQNDSLSKIINLAKSDGITDPDASCSIIISKANKSAVAATEKETQYNELILLEQNIIDEANSKINSLIQSMTSKINQHKTELYENFTKNIIFNISRTRKKGDDNGQFKITNNTPYNIRLSGKIIIEVYNSSGGSIGTHYTGSLFECSYSPQRMTKGLLLPESVVNLNRGEDEFGFRYSSFLPKGDTTENFEYNSFCFRSFTSSERLINTKEYGDNEEIWPDPQEPDLTKGYKIISGGKFIPLDDEKRIEANNKVVYSSKEINFNNIASAKSWSEKSQIKSEEKKIKNAKIRLAKLQMDKSNENLIANSISDEKTKKNCTDHINNVALQEEEIFITNTLLNTFKSCDLDNGDLVWSLVLEEKADIQLKDQVLNLDYANIASAEALNMISNAKHRVSTNISGHYQINELPRGEYLIISNYSDNFIEGIFLANTSIDADGIFDLSNTNYFSIPSFGYLVSQFYENCSENTCTREDFKNSLNLQNIADEYESYQAALEESAAEIRRLCRSLGVASCS